MREKLIAYIDYLFEKAPEQAEELKNEIKSNTLDRYDDLLSKGMSEDDAFYAATASIGDVNALLRDLYSSKPSIPAEKRSPARALMLSLAVALYILCVVPVIALEGINDILGVCLMFVMIAVATALIIYRATAFKQRKNPDASQSEQIKTRELNRVEHNPAYHAISGALWTLAVAAYLIVSFGTHAWNITWLIFPIAVAVQNIIRSVFALAGGTK